MDSDVANNQFVNCTFQANVAAAWGGALTTASFSMLDGNVFSVIFTECTFIENVGSMLSSGISVRESGKVTIIGGSASGHSLPFLWNYGIADVSGFHIKGQQESAFKIGDKIFSMGVVSIADTFGIALAGAMAVALNSAFIGAPARRKP